MAIKNEHKQRAAYVRLRGKQNEENVYAARVGLYRCKQVEIEYLCKQVNDFLRVWEVREIQIKITNIHGWQKMERRFAAQTLTQLYLYT